jgi:hypothetical protein
MNDRLDELRAAADQADAEYRDEIARMRNQLEEAVGRAAWHYENLTLLESKMVERNAEIARLRLTAAERLAIELAVEDYTLNDDDDECCGTAATLRGLLERLK